MLETVITYGGADPARVDYYGFQPGFALTRGGSRLATVVVVLSYEAGVTAIRDLEAQRIYHPEAVVQLNNALILYGLQRLEALVSDPAFGAEDLPKPVVWELTMDNILELVALATSSKPCDYQRRTGRDLFCIAAAKSDRTAEYHIEGRRAAPTSRPACDGCGLPRSDHLCSHLLHAEVGDAGAEVRERDLYSAACDRGSPKIEQPGLCRPGGHDCWQRLVAVEQPVTIPTHPLGLPEAFDVLDAMWRLALGKKRRLLSLTSLVGPAALALDCTNRAEFESRLSALADTIDLMKVEDDLLPAGLTDEQKIGSIRRLSECLKWKLSTEQYARLEPAIRTLQLVRQARNAMQHSKADGGFMPKLQAIGIHDAPPRWAEAWDSIRSQTAAALMVIRTELRRWVDAEEV